MSGLDKLFDPVDLAPRWTRPDPTPVAVRSAADALADLSAAVRGLDVPPRARAALAILLDQVASRVAALAALQAAPRAPAPPAAARVELAGLLDRLEDHLEALVLYAPRTR